MEANNAYIFTRFGLGVVMYGAICIFHMSHATVAPLYSMNKIKCTFYVLNMNKIRCVTLHVYLPYINTIIKCNYIIYCLVSCQQNYNTIYYIYDLYCP